jgi:hypothetical protein
LTRAFCWWVKEDDLVLYPNFMYNRLQRHAPFQELGTEEHERRWSTVVNGAYLLPALPISTAFAYNRIPSQFAVVPRAVKLGAPNLSDVLQPLEKDTLDLLV